MIKFYFKASSHSSRKIAAFLNDNRIEYTGKNVGTEGITKEEFFEILAGTESGVEDILSTNSKAYKDLAAEGIAFEDMSLSEIHYSINKHPSLLKFPIMVKNNVTLVGYSDDNVSLLRKREDRMREHSESLKVAREIDKVHFMKMRDDYKETAV